MPIFAISRGFVLKEIVNLICPYIGASVIYNGIVQNSAVYFFHKSANSFYFHKNRYIIVYTIRNEMISYLVIQRKLWFLSMYIFTLGVYSGTSNSIKYFEMFVTDKTCIFSDYFIRW